MVTSVFLRILEEEVICFICFDYLRDFVIIDCGYVFCRSCIIDIRLVLVGRFVCSFCKKFFKKENIRFVWQLVSLVENIERLKVDKGRQSGEVVREQQDAKLCERYQEKLYYYCEDDGKLLCVMCREFREYRFYTVIFVEKVVQFYRVSSRLKGVLLFFSGCFILFLFGGKVWLRFF